VTWGAERETSAELAGAQVLVVEDEAVIAWDIESILCDAGARVVGPAGNLSEALQLADRPDLSAAVLDVRVGADEVEAVARRLTHRHVPFLFYSGQADVDAVRRQWPDAVFLSKPAPPSAIVAAVKAQLARALGA
jgi:DNA-binding NtrC family response regulator